MNNLKLKREGEVYTTQNYGGLIITEYKDAWNVKVKFVNTGCERVVAMGDIKKGAVKDFLQPSIFGIGILGEEFENSESMDKVCTTWRSILTRCYYKKDGHIAEAYKDCTMSENFKYYQYFKKWYLNQNGWNEDDWAIDKDILVRGNKIYSEDTCCLVPREINNLFTLRHKLRGDYPLGVHFDKKSSKFISQLGRMGKRTYLGSYNNVEDAFNTYKQAKEDYIKEVANIWRDRIEPRVYTALITYQVEITD